MVGLSPAPERHAVPRCAVPLRAGDPAQIQPVPAQRGESVQQQGAGAPVAFPERVHVIYVADNDSRFAAESLPAQTFQKIAAHKAFMYVGHARFDILAKLELLAALVEFDGADFPRPGIYILEQMPMNGPEMIEVEATLRQTLGGSLRHKQPFDMIEFCRAQDPELVS